MCAFSRVLASIVPPDWLAYLNDSTPHVTQHPAIVVSMVCVQRVKFCACWACVCVCVCEQLKCHMLKWGGFYTSNCYCFLGGSKKNKEPQNMTNTWSVERKCECVRCVVFCGMALGPSDLEGRWLNGTAARCRGSSCTQETDAQCSVLSVSLTNTDLSCVRRSGSSKCLLLLCHCVCSGWRHVWPGGKINNSKPRTVSFSDCISLFKIY